MGRIVEIVVGLNALGGIAVFLLGRRAAWKIKNRIVGPPKKTVVVDDQEVDVTPAPEPVVKRSGLVGRFRDDIERKF